MGMVPVKHEDSGKEMRQKLHEFAKRGRNEAIGIEYYTEVAIHFER